MKQILWLDVDGVLVDYTRPFLKFANLSITYDDLFDYDLRKLFKTEDECLNTMLNFAMSEEFAKLPPIMNPVLLEALHNVGYELRIITKLPAPSAAKVNRIKNLTALFGPIFKEIIFTGNGECKLEYLHKRKQHEPDATYILVEDNPELLAKADELFFKNIELFEQLEIKAIAHPYNSKTVDMLTIIRAQVSFDDVAEDLLTRKVQ